MQSCGFSWLFLRKTAQEACIRSQEGPWVWVPKDWTWPICHKVMWTGRWCSLRSQVNWKFTFSLPPQRDIINDWFCVRMWSMVIIKPPLNLSLRVTFLCFICSPLKWQSFYQFPQGKLCHCPYNVVCHSTLELFETQCTELLSVFILCLCTKHRYCYEESFWNR